MIYKKIGRIDTPASAVGMGCWNIGNQWGEMSDDDACAIVRTAVDNGITLIDNADSYGIPHGLSELRLGKAIAGLRDKLVLVSKIGNWGARSGLNVPLTTPDMVRLCGHAIVGRLQTSHIDVVLCHKEVLPEAEYRVYVEGFRALRAEGFVTEFGVSTSDLGALKAFWAASEGECAVVETDYSLLHEDAESNGFLDFCTEHNIAVLTRGPLRMGVLSGRYDRDTVFTDTIRSGWNKGGKGRAMYEQMMDRLDVIKPRLARVPDMDMPTYALRYIISQKANIFAIPGATSPRQAAANAAAGARLLTAEELAFAK